MTVCVLWYDDQNTNKYIVGIFKTRESANGTRDNCSVYERENMWIEEFDLLD